MGLSRYIVVISWFQLLAPLGYKAATPAVLPFPPLPCTSPDSLAYQACPSVLAQKLGFRYLPLPDTIHLSLCGRTGHKLYISGLLSRPHRASRCTSLASSSVPIDLNLQKENIVNDNDNDNEHVGPRILSRWSGAAVPAAEVCVFTFRCYRTRTHIHIRCERADHSFNTVSSSLLTRLFQQLRPTTVRRPASPAAADALRPTAGAIPAASSATTEAEEGPGVSDGVVSSLAQHDCAISSAARRHG